MSMRLHVCTKREIEYAHGTIPYSAQPYLREWLNDCDVSVWGDDVWEIGKDELEAIQPSEYRDLCEGCSAEDCREFVKAMLDAPTGEYSYADWF